MKKIVPETISAHEGYSIAEKFALSSVRFFAISSSGNEELML